MRFKQFLRRAKELLIEVRDEFVMFYVELWDEVFTTPGSNLLTGVIFALAVIGSILYTALLPLLIPLSLLFVLIGSIINHNRNRSE